MTSLLWFRRDLRLHDNPALVAAVSDGMVVPVFIFDDRLLHGRHASGPRTQFMLECLKNLDENLQALGSQLMVRRGRPEELLPALAQEVGAKQVHAAADLTPFAHQRDANVRKVLSKDGIELHLHEGLCVVGNPAILTTQTGKPYTVFTPFYRTWLEQPRRSVLGAPHITQNPPMATSALPSLASLGLSETVPRPVLGGETEARKKLTQYLEHDVYEYVQQHDLAGNDRTSHLSAYLHFGCISPREVESLLGDDEGSTAFRRQLAWREFYHAILANFPDNTRHEFQERFRDMAWDNDPKLFLAWCEGRTGYPFVDAGMRQLRQEGWMHNRLRLVVGSFLTKDLGLDWRLGERHFMRWLIDGDMANNNGNWQWIASVGVDPQPVFRRLYNPARHQERYDADGHYVRTYVLELSQVPDQYLSEPWKMPLEIQQSAGCIIGQDYPSPIVDHREAREAALDRYRR